MSPKDKAKELVNSIAMRIDNSYRTDLPKRDTKHKAKQCALIAVGEILELSRDGNYLINKDYWQSVKDEITKL